MGIILLELISLKIEMQIIMLEQLNNFNRNFDTTNDGFYKIQTTGQLVPIRFRS